MSKFVKKVFIGFLSSSAKGSFGESLALNSKGSIKSLNNRPKQTRPTIVDINSNETLCFRLLPVSFNKFGGSCKTINDPYARVCVPNKLRPMYVKVFNLMPRIRDF